MSEPSRTPAQEVTVRTGEVELAANLDIPPAAAGLVIFAHGSGSSRHSPRNRFVAEQLQGRHLATLLLDLLTPDEEQIDLQTRHPRFDIPMLSERVAGAVDWAGRAEQTSGLPMGLFGASTGAAAALVAAAGRADKVRAVVSRGGRPDLAEQALPQVRCPVLLIVGGNDPTVLQMNRDAQSRMNCPTTLTVIPGASHLFEEPGKLEDVSKHAGAWFSEQVPN